MWVVALFLRVEFHYEYLFVNCYYRKYTFMNFCTKKNPKTDKWRLQVRTEKKGRGKFGRNT